MMDNYYFSLINAVLLIYLIFTAIAILRSTNLVTSVLLCSIFSLLMATIYVNMGALDVAITEAAVGAGVSTIFFLNALAITGHREKITNKHSTFALAVMAFTVASMGSMIKTMPPLGSIDNPIHNHISDYYLRATEQSFKIKNSVTAILASIRGYDTMCETAVVVTASICVLLIIGKEDKIEK